MMDAGDSRAAGCVRLVPVVVDDDEVRVGEGPTREDPGDRVCRAGLGRGGAAFGGGGRGGATAAEGLARRPAQRIAHHTTTAIHARTTCDGDPQVLEEIRPFLKMAGGDVELVSIDPGSVQPSATLRMTGSGTMIKSVRGEVLQRLRNKIPTLAGVLWDDPEWKDER